MKRRILVLAVGATVVACAIATACSSDEDASTPTLDSGAIETSAPEGGEDAGDATTSDQASPGDDAEAGGRGDADKPDSTANCISLDPCDCDNDGYKASSCKPDGGDAGVDAAVFNDCDDLDPVVYPGANRAYFTDPNPPRKGDLNCDNKVEKQYNVNLACGVALPCAGEGFKDDPPCGTAAPYFTCGGLAVCGAQAAGMRVQGCR